MEVVFNDVSVTFAGRVVLQPFSLRLTGRRIGIIGLNGSGKSTFSKMINGLVLPDIGMVKTNDFDTRAQAQEVRSRVGYVFQHPANQIVLPLIKDDMALGLKRLRLSRQEEERTVFGTAMRLGMGHLLERRAHELSGGEVQLAALASVLVGSPEIVIMDEPTNQLDLKNRNMVSRTIRSLPEDVIVITHDLELLSGFDRVLLFHDGRIVEDGPAQDVILRYQELVA